MRKIFDFLKRHKATLIPCLLILLFVVLANGMYVTKQADPNPLLQRSGLAYSQKSTILGGLDSIDPNNGFVSQALSNRAARDWLHGSVPYWNHYEGVGSPLAGEMQSAAFSPFVLLLRLANGLLIFHMLLEMIAGIATFLLIKKLGLRSSIATVAGIAFALNGTFSWLANAVVNPVAFLPLLLLGIEYAFSATTLKKRRGWLLISVALALSLVSGFPETAFINTLLVGIWALVRLWSLPTGELRKKYFLKLVYGFGAGLLLSAPILVAFVGYLPFADIGAHSGAYAYASFGPVELAPLLMPYIYGNIFGQSGFSVTQQLTGFWSSVGGYLTVSTAFLALFGLFSRLPRKLKIVLVAWIILCLLKVFGVHFVSTIINLIPTIKNAAFYRYAPPSIEFSVIILAAFGLDYITGEQMRRRNIGIVTALAAIILLVLVKLARPEVHNLSAARFSKEWAALSVLAALCAIIAILLSLLLVKRRYLTYVIGAVVVLESLVLFIVPTLSTPKVQFDDGPVRFLQAHLGTQRFYTLGPVEPNYGSYYDIASINQNDLPVPKDWAKYINTKLDTNTDPLLFVGYFRKDHKGPSAPDELYKNLAHYEAVGVKYVVAFPGQLKPADVEKYGLKLAYKATVADIYELPSPKPYFEVTEGSCKLQPSGRDTVTAVCDTPAKVVRRELNMPGWKVQSANGSLAVSTYDDIFQRVNLPKGTTSLTYTYTPPFMAVGVLALVAGSIWVAVVLLPDYAKKGRLQKMQRLLKG